MKQIIQFALLFIGSGAALLRIFGFRDQIPYWVVPAALGAYFAVKYLVKSEQK